MEEVRAAATVSWARAVDFTARAFSAVGVPADDARRAATALVDADGHGTVTHGLKNLRNYIAAVLAGNVNPRPRIRDVGGAAAARVITADNALGHVAGWAGMEKAIALAKEYGVGTTFVRDSNHYGASGFWARLALPHNMVGFAFTSALATVAPWGAREKLVGNNPPAWAIPTRVVSPGAPLPPHEADSVCLDIALSVVAGNRLDIYRRRGEPIPAGWALDMNGEPTTDPHAPRQGGTFRPMGEYKGSGMAIVLGMMSCFLAGAPFDDQRLTPDGDPDLRHLQPLVCRLRRGPVRRPREVHGGGARGPRPHPQDDAASRRGARVRPGRHREREGRTLLGRGDPDRAVHPGRAALGGRADGHHVRSPLIAPLGELVYDRPVGAWRSQVAHLPWEQGVGRSNRLAPTIPRARACSSVG